MPPAVRRSRSGRARAEAPASAAETSGALRSRHAIKKKKAIAETTAARAPLRTTIAVATLTDSARASPEKDAKPVARGKAPRARARTRARGPTGADLNHSERPAVPSETAPRRETRDAPRGRKCRVYVLTYFFSSLTIDKQRALGVPFGWLGSAAASGSASPSVTATCSCRAARPLGRVRVRFRRRRASGHGGVPVFGGRQPAPRVHQANQVLLGDVSASRTAGVGAGRLTTRVVLGLVPPAHQEL